MDNTAERIAKGLCNVIYPVSRALNRIGVGLVMIIVLVIAADIISRFLFNRPVPGSLEIAELSLPLVIFLAIAYTGIEKRHVGIDILYDKFPKASRDVIDAFNALLSGVVVALISWQFFLRAALAFIQGEKGDVIGLPYWPVMYAIAIGCVLMLLVLVADFFYAVGKSQETCRHPAIWLLLILTATTAITLSPGIMKELSVEFSKLQTGLIFISLMLILMFLKMPIAFCMGFTGFVGLWYLKDLDKILPLMAMGPWVVATNWSYSVIPTFVLMGMFAYHSRISRELYEAGYRWFGHQPGGLALTTVAACGGFASICGCSTATAGTMGTIALPEMKKFKYHPSLSAGSVAAGGTLGILIPPSLGFMVYGVITEQSIGRLFVAGILPGILLAGMFMLSIYVRCRINPALGPIGPKFNFKQKVWALKNTWSMLLLFFFVMGGLYLGIFTPTEAGAMGAVGSLVIGLLLKRLSWRSFNEALIETGRLTAMIFTILCCVKILGYFIALTQIPFVLSELVISYNLSKYSVLMLILLLYVVLGMMMNIVPMMVLTLPIIFPMVMELGFDPIWFGVLMVVMMEMGQITPPVGINTFVVSGVAPDIPIGTIFKGIMPFWFMQIITLILLTLFPWIATYLPRLM